MSSVDDILKLVERLKSDSGGPNGKSPVKHLGFISCGNTVHLRHVPFYDPCIIMVLAGRKVILDEREPISCEAGCAITAPGPASLDLRNEPDPRSGKYRALVIPFKQEHLKRLREMHDMDYVAQRAHIGVLKFEYDEALVAAVKHYLESPSAPRLLSHRLMEILLILVEKNPRLLSYALAGESWSQRVRAVLSTDLACEWDIGEICKRLATSESTLRRNLRREGTGFRELLYDLRLSTALMRLLQTSLPVYRIAYDCGYQSVSRFSNNFRRRFGLPPTELRVSVDEKGHRMAVNEHPRAF